MRGCLMTAPHTADSGAVFDRVCPEGRGIVFCPVFRQAVGKGCGIRRRERRSHMDRPALLEMKNISKEFPGVKALEIGRAHV